MTHPNVTPDLLDELIGRCKEVLARVDTVARRVRSVDLIAIRDHLITAEQRDLGEWIRDLPPESVGNFRRDMEVSAKLIPILTLAVHLSPRRMADDG